MVVRRVRDEAVKSRQRDGVRAVAWWEVLPCSCVGFEDTVLHACARDAWGGRAVCTGAGGSLAWPSVQTEAGAVVRAAVLWQASLDQPICPV